MIEQEGFSFAAGPACCGAVVWSLCECMRALQARERLRSASGAFTLVELRRESKGTRVLGAAQCEHVQAQPPQYKSPQLPRL